MENEPKEIYLICYEKEETDEDYLPVDNDFESLPDESVLWAKNEIAGMECIKYIHAETSQQETARLREALGVNDAWPITDVLLKLIEATEYLLDVKNYDKTGWEEVSHCTKVGRKMMESINEALNQSKP